MDNCFYFSYLRKFNIFIIYDSYGAVLIVGSVGLATMFC